jgi:hypothetical protein
MSVSLPDAAPGRFPLVAQLRRLWALRPWGNRIHDEPVGQGEPVGVPSSDEEFGIDDEEFGIAPAPQRTKRRSYEWITFGDDDVVCWAPWRVLRVDVFGRTQNCCGFFERMPDFEWPSARDFHKETGMWNHPVVQRLRSTMGTPDELPFCTLCKEEDKRHPDLAAAKRDAAIRSRDVFQEVYDRAAPFRFRGGVDRVTGDLRSWTVASRLFPEKSLQPFRSNKLVYRRLVRRSGFWNLGHVLLMGVQTGSMTPFLAEANESLTLADLIRGRLRNNADILHALEFGEAATTLLTDPCTLPWQPDTFDGVWLDGSWLSRFGRLQMLKELRRVVRRGAPLHVSAALGIGPLVRQAVAAATQEEARATIDVIGKGPGFAGIGGFMSAETLVAALKGSGFDLDRSHPALTRYNGRTKAGTDDWSNHWSVAQLLSDESYRSALKAQPERLKGIVERVSFTARAE